MRILLCFAILLSVAGRPLRATVVETLTMSDIEDAIRLGKFGSPSPYRIYNSGSTPAGRPRGLVMAVVYTPFIRVALAVKEAYDNGRDFAPNDVTADLTRPVLYVAYRWYCCVDHAHGEGKTTWEPHREPFDYRIATGSDRYAGTLQLSLPPTPLSVTRDLSLLSRFGDRPYDDLVLMATYPIAESARMRDFAIYRTESYDGHVGTVTIPGQVTPEDLAGWR